MSGRGSWADEEWFDLIPNTTSARARHGPITAPAYEHAVRAAPSLDSPVIGHLIPGLSVQARLAPAQQQSSKGSGFNWLYVRYHMRAKAIPAGTGVDGGPLGEWGYALRSDRGHVFLVRAETYSDDEEDDEGQGEDQGQGQGEDEGDEAGWRRQDADTATSSGSASAAAFPETWSDGVDVWQELYDASNACNYYYNARTGESSWTAPEWVEETDDKSGANYYVSLNPLGAVPLHSTWSRPKQFARLFRLGTGAGAGAGGDSIKE